MTVIKSIAEEIYSGIVRILIGPGSFIKKKGNHPVAQVSWDDANAYAEWEGIF